MTKKEMQNKIVELENSAAEKDEEIEDLKSRVQARDDEIEVLEKQIVQVESDLEDASADLPMRVHEALRAVIGPDVLDPWSLMPTTWQNELEEALTAEGAL